MEILPKKGKSGRKRRRKGGGRGRRRNAASLGGLVVACALALLGFALMAANVQGVFAKAIDPALARALPELHGHMTYSPDVSLSLSGALELRDVKVDFDRPGDRYARLTKASAPKLRVRLGVPETVLFFLGRRDHPSISSVSIPELDLSWSRSTPVLNDGAKVAPATKELLLSPDLAALAGPKIRVGKLRISSPDGGRWEVSGLRTSFRGKRLRLEAKELSGTSLPTLRSVEADVDVSPERLVLSSARLSLLGGKATADGEIPLRGNPRARVRARISGVDLKAAADFFVARPLDLSGSADATVDAVAPLLSPLRSFSAVGNASVSNARVRGLAVQKSPLVRRMAPEFADLSFDRISLAGLRVTRDSLLLGSLAGTGPQFDFSGRGKADTKWNFSATIDARIRPETARRLPAATRMGLAAGSDGSRTVRLQVAGNPESQRIVNSGDIVRQGIRNAVRFWK